MDKSFRYKQLDTLLRHEDGYTLNELVSMLDDDISKRTLRREISKLENPPYNMRFAQDLYRGKEKIIRYKDISQSLFDVQGEMKESFDAVVSALNNLSGIPQYDWMKVLFLELSNHISLDAQSVISFDNNFDLVGIEHIATLTKAILHKRPQRIQYKTFNGRSMVVNVHPYHLRQYRNRWFLLCLTEGLDALSNYALDRIESLSDVSIKYRDTDIDFEEWFEDVIGVTVPQTPVQSIVLKVSNNRYGYIRTKPLHPSQRVRKDLEEENYTFIEIRVKENKELISTIASFGADVEVVQPAEVREQLKLISEQMNNLYQL